MVLFNIQFLEDMKWKHRKSHHQFEKKYHDTCIDNYGADNKVAIGCNAMGIHSLPRRADRCASTSVFLFSNILIIRYDEDRRQPNDLSSCL